METTLYDDNNRQSVKKMKMGMSLDLTASEQQKKGSVLKQAKLEDPLTMATPDLGLFMLASPDLERFIQQNGMVLTTPTPTTQILFPKTVTEEQEAYARGFVDALGELHKNYGAPMIGSTATGTVAGTRGTVVPQKILIQKQQGIPNFTTTTTTMLPGSVFARSTAQGVNLSQASRGNLQMGMMVQPKIEVGGPPQTVPTFRGSVTPSSSVSVAPINMDDQESAKLDRKRARNRLAATRCRNRKLERISRLEDRVKELKGQNSRLGETAAALREQVLRLKQNIMEHTQSGCQVMMTHNLL